MSWGWLNNVSLCMSLVFVSNCLIWECLKRIVLLNGEFLVLIPLLKLAVVWRDPCCVTFTCGRPDIQLWILVECVTAFGCCSTLRWFPSGLVIARPCLPWEFRIWSSHSAKYKNLQLLPGLHGETITEGHSSENLCNNLLVYFVICFGVYKLHMLLCNIFV
ncbi:hypothetical protein ACHQM5_001741 [Ranunculus cassubicifolius]